MSARTDIQQTVSRLPLCDFSPFEVLHACYLLQLMLNSFYKCSEMQKLETEVEASVVLFCSTERMGL